MYKYLYQHASFSCCQYLNRVHFFSEWLTWRKTPSHLLPSSTLSSPGWSYGDSCLEMESRKRFACDVLHNFVTHSSIVYDVTDTDCWSENGSTHCRVYYGFEMSIFNKEKSIFFNNNNNNNKSLLCTYYVFHRGLVLPLLLCWNRAMSEAILSPVMCNSHIMNTAGLCGKNVKYVTDHPFCALQW